MAQRLIAHGAALVVALGASSAGQAARAQTLADPMRPPQASTAERPAQSVQGEPLAPGASRLQSILISPARRLAVIDGAVVPLGGRVGDATVIAITEAGVVLKKGEQRETLNLYPSVQIKPVPRLQPSKVTQ